MKKPGQVQHLAEEQQERNPSRISGIATGVSTSAVSPGMRWRSKRHASQRAQERRRRCSTPARSGERVPAAASMSRSVAKLRVPAPGEAHPLRVQFRSLNENSTTTASGT